MLKTWLEKSDLHTVFLICQTWSPACAARADTHAKPEVPDITKQRTRTKAFQMRTGRLNSTLHLRTTHAFQQHNSNSCIKNLVPLHYILLSDYASRTVTVSAQLRHGPCTGVLGSPQAENLDARAGEKSRDWSLTFSDMRQDAQTRQFTKSGAEEQKQRQRRRGSY